MAFEDIRRMRLEKSESIKKRGFNPFPSAVRRTHHIRALISDFETLKTSSDISIAGRIISLREHGGSTFANLEDYSGAMQIYFKKDVLAEHYDFFIEHADLGDFIEARGNLFLTKRGEKTLEVREWKMLSKTLRPIPEKWYGLEDVEERFRRRYLDLLANKEVKKVFETRSKMIAKIRTFLDGEEFLEVETPILQALPGGASARPFETRLNALAMDLYLRIAPELYLKRLIVGGFEKVYELGRSFRNEGMDRTHNPEFTMLELYIAYEDYRGLMNFTEQLLQHAVRELFGTLEIESNGNKINFNHAPWKRVEFEALVNSALGEDHKNISLADLKKKFKSLGIKADAKIMKHKAKMVDEVFKKIALPKIIDPTFVINHPVEISPLAKGIEGNPEKVERFQLIAGGLEIVNGFSELNDPIEQERRFKAQEKLKKAGDAEAQSRDMDFVEALEYGMPPAAGLGIGIDRLAMLLTDSKTIRDVLLFPTMRPRKK